MSATRKTKNFDALRARVDADPERRTRVEQHKAAIQEAVRLGQMREAVHLTQQQLASKLGVSQVNVSRIERAGDVNLSTLGRYVTALGGRLELHAVFDDQALPIALPLDEDPAPRRTRSRRAPATGS
ncbi:MAG: helix-turn-helix domain-containing protein [Thermoleophilaceae bacterium]